MIEKRIEKHNNLEKILTTAGLSLLGLTLLATIFGVWKNWSFVTNPDPILNSIYYCRYLLLLGGGFMIGYAFVSLARDKKQPVARIFNAVVYGLLAFVIYNLLDVLRVLVRDIFGTLPYPWEKILFMGGPIIALLVLLGIAIIIKSPTLPHLRLKRTFVVLFVVQQISTVVLALSNNFGNTVPPYGSLETLLIGVITLPLFIAAVAYIVLNNVKGRLTRAFYSSVIGVIYAAVSIIVWEFRTNPEAGATTIFSIIATIASLTAAALVVLYTRKAVVYTI